MPEIGTFGLMSGDGKRSVGHRPQATAPVLDSTEPSVPATARVGPEVGVDLPMVAGERAISLDFLYGYWKR